MISFVHTHAYLQLVRFSHTLFALPFALLSYFAALKLNGTFRLADILGILLCMVFARSAAMGFNRFADRFIDAANPRTANRHLPLRLVSPGGVLMFIIGCSLGFIASTLLFLPNRIPLVASLPVLMFLFGYSYTKRWTIAAHYWLGMCLCFAPIAVWAAVRPVYEMFPVLLGLAVLFWTAGFDIIYATQDADFDRQMNLFSIPGRFGIKNALRISALSHCVAVGFFAALPLVYPYLSGLWEFGAVLTAVILSIEHFLSRSAGNNLDRINVAFFQMNVIVSVGLLLFGVADVMIFTPLISIP